MVLLLLLQTLQDLLEQREQPGRLELQEQLGLLVQRELPDQQVLREQPGLTETMEQLVME